MVEKSKGAKEKMFGYELKFGFSCYCVLDCIERERERERETEREDRLRVRNPQPGNVVPAIFKKPSAS